LEKEYEELDHVDVKVSCAKGFLFKVEDKATLLQCFEASESFKAL